MDQIVIRQITGVSEATRVSLNKLLLQLSSRGYQLSSKEFQRVLSSDNIYLLGLYCNRELVGTISLVELNQITGHKGYLEDIVVDAGHRRKGYATALIKKAITLAKQLKIYRLELKSETARRGANKLYKKLGFKQKEANVYQILL